MPTKTGKTVSSYYGNDVTINQSSNTGIDSTTREIQDGFGNNTAISLSDDVLSVKPVNDDTTSAMLVKNQAGSNVLAVDTTNSKVLVGASQVSATTMFKEMGLYEFSPVAGYHNPLIANNVGMQGAEALTSDNDWGNATDPPTSLDLSGLTDPENAIAVYWYIENNITLDTVRWMARADDDVTLNFHLFSYDLDTTTNFGDLSGGSLHATASVTTGSNGYVKTGTFLISTPNIDAGKVVIGFCENQSSDDFSVHFNIKYQIQ